MTIFQFESTISEFAREPNSGLIVLPDGTANTHRELIVTLAATTSCAHNLCVP